MFFKNDDNPRETRERLEKKLWDELDGSSPFVMLGLQGVEDSRTRPMTVQIDDDGPGRQIYFFADKHESLVADLGQSHRAIASFSSKGHDLFAHIHGDLAIDQDRAVIDRLWNPMIAAWYEGDKDDPNLVLLRFDTGVANIWESSKEGLVTAALEALGADPDTPDVDEHRADARL